MVRLHEFVAGKAGLGFLFLLLVVGGIGGAAHASGIDPMNIDLDNVFSAPNLRYWLGADDLGRDVLARLAAGMYVSLTVGCCVFAVTALIGIPLGFMAGWYEGGIDRIITKLAEVVLSFPGLLLALALAALVGGGLFNVIAALGLLGWVGFCRLARVEVQKLKRLAFVDAARLAGVPTHLIFMKHLLPNCAAPLLVEALLVFGGAMVAEAGLSFLGLGIPVPQPSLGGMLRDGMRTMLLQPMLVLYPAVVLIGLTISVNLIAEGLRRRWAGGNETL